MSNISRNNGGKTPNVLCFASYQKGHRFLTQGKKHGRRVYLMTSDRLQDAGCSSESIDEILFMPSNRSEWNLAHKDLWKEWAKLESFIIKGSSYSACEVCDGHAGLPVSLARQEWPDTSVFSDPEVVRKLAKRHHIGLVVSSSDDRRVAELIDSYRDSVRKDFHATAPAREKVEY